MSNLTIAIPTYNRIQTLRANLPALLAQLTKECHLVILDNHSSTLVEDAIADLLQRYQHANITILRHPANIGGNANILRCMELCESRWLWVLGDDDHVLPNAVETITKTMERHDDKCFVNFSSELAPRHVTKETKGLEQFVQQMDSFGNSLLISTGLYQALILRPLLGYGYQYGVYANGPLFAILQAALAQGARCLFSEKRIVSYNPEPGPAVPYALRIMTLLDAKMDSATRQALAAKIGMWPSHEAIVAELLALAKEEGNTINALYYYDQTRARFSYFESPLRRLKWRVARSLIKHHHLAEWGLRLRRKIRRRSEPNIDFKIDCYDRL